MVFFKILLWKFLNTKVELTVITNFYISITQPIGAYDLDIRELPNKLNGFSSVFKEK